MRVAVSNLFSIMIILSIAGCVANDPLDIDVRDYDEPNVENRDTASGAETDTGPGEMTLPCSSGECCMKDGVAYDRGETLRFTCDGCENTCTCGGDGAWSCTDCACASACDFEGTGYSPGDTFPASDGCNQCECERVHLGFGFSEARITCTEEICPPPVPVCEMGGVEYPVGDSIGIPCIGCENRCTCEQLSEQRAAWECTECECATECLYEDVTYAVGDLFLASDGCNQCECELVELSLGFTEARTFCTTSGCTEPMCLNNNTGHDPGDEINVWCSDRVGKVCVCTAGDDMPSWDCREEAPCNQECTYGEQTFSLGEVFLAEDRQSSCLHSRHVTTEEFRLS